MGNHQNSHRILDEGSSADPIMTMEELIAMGEEFSKRKNLIIFRSVTGITSAISSSVLIWMIVRSHKGLSTTQHRILLALSICDLTSSFAYSTFNFMAPSDNDYFVWNARGNEATCDAFGFLLGMGVFGGLWYNAALNLYFVAVNKLAITMRGGYEEYIRAKIEPFLLCVPIVLALVYCIVSLVGEQFNDNGFGVCFDAFHKPPHCNGYNVTDIREGFEIPCGRGLAGSNIRTIATMVCLSIPIVIMIISLKVIYSSYRQLELKFSTYRRQSMIIPAGVPQQSTEDSHRSSSLGVRFRTSVTHLASSIGRISSIVSENPQSQNSRRVMQKAFAYSFAWLLSYGSYIIAKANLIIAGESNFTLVYVSGIFTPLQGFFNLIIYMYPKVISARKQSTLRGGERISLCQAIVNAFLSGDNDRRRSQTANRGNRLRPTREQVLVHREPQEEEEKREIQPEVISTIPQQSTLHPMYAPNVSHHAINSNDMDLTVTAEVGDCGKDSDDEGSIEEKHVATDLTAEGDLKGGASVGMVTSDEEDGNEEILEGSDNGEDGQLGETES